MYESSPASFSQLLCIIRQPADCGYSVSALSSWVGLLELFVNLFQLILFIRALKTFATLWWRLLSCVALWKS